MQSEEERLVPRRRMRRRPGSSPSRFEGGAFGADGEVAARAGSSHSHSPFVTARLACKCSALVVLSMALSLALLDTRGLFVAAVDPPTVRATRGAPPNVAPSDPGDDNHSEAVDDRLEEKPMESIHASAEDSMARDDEEAVGGDKRRDSSTYESKTSKQQPPASNRKRQQRQKQKRQNKQQQQQLSGQQVGGTSHNHKSRQEEYDSYMRWCEKVLGIQSVVEIEEFEYPDHLQIHWEESDGDGVDDYDSEGFDWLKKYTTIMDTNDENVDDGSEDEELPTKLVRGLAAKYDIQVGDIVISIPLYSLLSIPTTIDHDPVLSRILGPSARQKYGWTDTAEYELPLLVLAVLYHRSLGPDSPISHYIEILLGTPTDSFPFLWTDRELREKAGGSEEVKSRVRGIRQDLYDMYDGVMGTLVKERPEWFAPPEGGVSEWIYSYENFRWAFALVASRHHYLPISDFDEQLAATKIVKRPTVKTADSPSSSQMQETLSTVSEVVPPANQPTDSWVDEAHNEERVTEEDVVADDDATPQPSIVKHSFLAPLADLINFGPPCLTGSYNEVEHVFELIATCPFAKGQEVTFWYSSDCSDVIIANFGFLHPLVPPCAAPVDWEKTSEEWREKTEMREQELWERIRKMDLLRDELAEMQSRLLDCDCGEDEQKKPIYSMPTASTAHEANHKLRNGHRERHDIGVRGRMHEMEQRDSEMMEELG